jgi:hypothetical protein
MRRSPRPRTGCTGCRRFVKAHQLGVGARSDLHERLDLGLTRAQGHGKHIAFVAVRDFLPVHFHRKHRQRLRIEAQRPAVGAIALNGEAGPDLGPLRLEPEIERDPRHQPVGRAVILAADHGGAGGSVHGVEHERQVGLAPHVRNAGKPRRSVKNPSPGRSPGRLELFSAPCSSKNRTSARASA